MALANYAHSRGLLLVALIGAGGCLRSSFRCDADRQCTGAAGGRCEPTGYCSFAEGDGGTCPSGRRYFQYSDALSSRCVEVEAIAFEAEAGVIEPSMEVVADPSASGGAYVWSTIDETGTVSFTLTVTATGDYVVWCRVRSPTNGHDSFYVSMDGGADVTYDTAYIDGQNHWIDAWQWTPVNDEMATRIFRLTPGAHALRFRSRERQTPLDRLIVTTDPAFSPPP
jgi:hypothetical protein